MGKCNNLVALNRKAYNRLIRHYNEAMSAARLLEGDAAKALFAKAQAIKDMADAYARRLS
jgi:hypothetical protein